MNKDTKIVLITLGGGILFFLLLGYFVSIFFGAGSYPFAEEYELNYSERKVIDLGASGPLVHIYFIYPDKKQEFILGQDQELK